MTANNSAVSRLSRDLKEVVGHGQVAAMPVNDDMFTWHCNVAFDDTFSVHLELKFSESYPTTPPKVTLPYDLPHRNVMQCGQEHGICMDMLETGTFGEQAEKSWGYTGWSSGYTVLSVLLQIQSLLRDESMVHERQPGQLHAAKTRYRQHVCATCPHAGKKHWPRIERCASQETKLVVSRPIRLANYCFDTPLSVRTHATAAKPPTAVVAPKPAAATQQKGNPWGEVPSTKKKKKTTPPPVKLGSPWAKTTSPAAAAKSPAPAKVAVAPAPAASPCPEVWSEVCHSKRKRKAKKAVEESTAVLPRKEDNYWTMLLATKDEDSARPQTVLLEQQAVPAENTLAEDTLPAAKLHKLRSKNKRKNEARSRKRAARRAQQENVMPSRSPANLPRGEMPQVALLQCPAAAAASAEEETPMDLVASASLKGGMPVVVNDGDEMGSFAVLPYEVTLAILAYVPMEGLRHVRAVCRGLHSVADDGFLWRTVFQQRFPGSCLTAATVHDWKTAFFLEANHVAGELVCYHTKASFDEDVLGIPIEYTINPRTQLVDYIYSSHDILSEQAFVRDNVRLTPYKEKFTMWLPLYITEEHFQKGLGRIQKCLSMLCGGGAFDPSMVLEVIPKLMNTLVVLLCDKGVHTSEKAINGYCQIQRLFLALLAEFPVLIDLVNRRVKDFMASPRNRVKEECRSIGDFLPLLAVAQHVSWSDVSFAVIDETFSRQVLWTCREYPALANLKLGAPAGEADFDRLAKTFEASAVSLRLLMFHSVFLRFVARPSGVRLATVAAGLDQLYGRPSEQTRSFIRAKAVDILNVKDWPGFFAMIGGRCPPPAKMTSWLIQAVRDSLRKRYHNKNTNFSRIQKSGVSKILVRGESYVAPKDLQKVILEDRWGYAEETEFLDASCLLYSEGKFVEVVDFCHKRSSTGAITHSGDMMNDAKKEGKHTINVGLAQLPPSVDTIILALSAYGSSVLADIQQPYVRLIDPASDTELCRYNLEDQDTGINSAVVMCRLSRTARGWEVVAIGDIGMGRADSYDALYKTIEKKGFASRRSRKK